MMKVLSLSRILSWLVLLGCLLGAARAQAQDPQLPTRKSGLEQAPLQTLQLDEVRPADTAKVFSLQDLAELVYANRLIAEQGRLLHNGVVGVHKLG